MSQPSGQLETATSDVAITSGPAKVVASGTVINFKGNPLRISLKELGVDLVIVFRDEGKSDDIHIDAKADVGGVLNLTLVNFNNALGIGLKEPMRIGIFEGQQALLNVRVYSLANSVDRLLHYTVYLAEPGA